ncbi:MlaD family protein [Nocardioides sp. J54]|uniref:MlaD family protein n=1 Tax=Nocardioides sp. J54 TaxID=935866 RepID=UPI00049047E7|nr:MlaD family protein [Nocardioides sp. J54]
MTRNRLTRAWERARTVPGLGRDVAAILALVLAGLLVAGVILAKQRVHWPWQDEVVIQADFRSVPAISPGNGQEVRIAGVTVGRITEADVTDDGRARLTLSIEPGNPVYKDTHLVLRPKTPLNDMYVEMSQGTEAAGELEDGAVIPVEQTSNPVQVDEVLSHLDDSTRAALTTLLGESDVALASAAKALPAGLDAADETLGTLRPVVKAMAQRRESIASLVTSLRTIATAAGADDARLQRLVTSLATTVETLAAHDGDVRAALKALPGATDQLREATSAVTELSTELDPALVNLRKASGELPSALAAVGKVAKEVEDTAQRARPVVAELRPVVADLRPFVRALQPALDDVVPIASRLDRGTRILTERFTDLQAFVYNTASVVSLQDANGGILRGQVQVNTSTLPIPINKDR